MFVCNQRIFVSEFGSSLCIVCFQKIHISDLSVILDFMVQALLNLILYGVVF